MGIVQEKGELEFLPLDDDNGHEWTCDRDARVKKGTPGREGRRGGDWQSKAMDNAVLYNGLPPGSDVRDQEMADIRKMRSVVGGTDDVTDNPKGQDFVKGFVDITMHPVDDMYTNEHIDTFYSEAKVDGKVGFLERGNVLDRN
jgi:hypothetical protein